MGNRIRSSEGTASYFIITFGASLLKSKLEGMRNTFRILFYIKRTAPDRNGRVPIMVRITINGNRTQFSTQQHVDPRLWDVHGSRVAGRTAAAARINGRLSDIRQHIEQCYHMLLSREGRVSASRVREAYFGGGTAGMPLLGFFRQHNDDFRRMVGINRSRATLYKYESVYKLLQSYVRMRYGRNDIPFADLDMNFPAEFHRYIAYEVPHERNTVWVYMIALKHILALAKDRNYLTSNPFSGYKLHRSPVMRDYLTETELQNLLRIDPGDSMQRLILDAFLFSCFTGLSYIDLCRLTLRNIRSTSERSWICTTRSKTGTEVYVRLFDIPLAILSKYRTEATANPIFPLPSNGWCNVCLRRVLQKAGIQRPVTFHCARHTFATTITLSQGIPIESISRMLGHKNIRTTQIYAAITHAQLDNDMDRLSSRLRLHYVRS